MITEHAYGLYILILSSSDMITSLCDLDSSRSMFATWLFGLESVCGDRKDIISMFLEFIVGLLVSWLSTKIVDVVIEITGLEWSIPLFGGLGGVGIPLCWWHLNYQGMEMDSREKGKVSLSCYFCLCNCPKYLSIFFFSYPL